MTRPEGGKFIPFDSYEMENPYEQISIGLETVQSFEKLYEVLNAQGSINDPFKIYSAERLRVKIEQIRHGHEDITSVTTSNGIRKAVERLLETDSVYKKYTSGSKAKKINK